jgi:hypothetical protein
MIEPDEIPASASVVRLVVDVLGVEVSLPPLAVAEGKDGGAEVKELLVVRNRKEPT